jgi:hypothetical protein
VSTPMKDQPHPVKQWMFAVCAKLPLSWRALLCRFGWHRFTRPKFWLQDGYSIWLCADCEQSAGYFGPRQP